MKVFFLGNGALAATALQIIAEAGEEVVGLALHPEPRRRAGAEILAACPLPPERVFDGSRLAEPGAMERVRDLDADAALSVLFGYVLEGGFLDLFPRGALNLHPSYLPWNRGAHPNVWSLVEGTPAGVSLHRMEPKVDSGPILARRRVEVEPVDTAARLYDKLLKAAAELLAASWTPWAEGRLEPCPQDPASGSEHRVADLARLDCFDLDRTYTARELLNQLRARTFPPHPGAWFRDDAGRRVEVRVTLRYLDETAVDDAEENEP